MLAQAYDQLRRKRLIARRLTRRTTASMDEPMREEKPMITEILSIPRRFNGPPRSGNGGYVCGRLAKYVSGPVSVRLRVPPPLEQELKVEASDDEARLFDGEVLVAHARRIELEVATPAAPTFTDAMVASRSYVGFVRHLLPTCFVCGPERDEGDGLRIFPGRAEASLLAAPWVPDASLANSSGFVSSEFLWAALDCAGAFAVMPEGSDPILLGELSARLDREVAIGEKCVVVAWPLGLDGRKRYAGTAIYSGSGALVAVARATWIEIPAARSPDSPAIDKPR